LKDRRLVRLWAAETAAGAGAATCSPPTSRRLPSLLFFLPRSLDEITAARSLFRAFFTLLRGLKCVAVTNLFLSKKDESHLCRRRCYNPRERARALATERRDKFELF